MLWLAIAVVCQVNNPAQCRVAKSPQPFDREETCIAMRDVMLSDLVRELEKFHPYMAVVCVPLAQAS